jgi:predicted nuclease of restriction endonuclease-like (RecB) superfamily
MRAFYNAYTQETILPPTVGELQTPNKNTIPQLITQVSWSHNSVIVEKCKDLHQRIFYIVQARNYGWTKNVLIHQIENQTFEKTAINQSNFETALNTKNYHNATVSLKDDYTFDFLELTEKHSEYQLEQAILNNIRKFLIEMGGDFAFVGNQYTISLNNKDYKIDLLLFHRELQALIAVELKVTEFIPEYGGKMNFYLSLLNERVKKPHENPSIGIIICKSKDRTTVEFALQDVNKPIGVATYSISEQLPVELKDFFPTPAELRTRVEQISSILKIRR